MKEAMQSLGDCGAEVGRALLDLYRRRFPGRPRFFYARSKNIPISSQGTKAAGMRYLRRKGVVEPHSGNGKHTLVWKIDSRRLKKVVGNNGGSP